MALIIENGTGVFGANSYESEAFVTAYLTARNRATENGWAAITTVAETAACVAATDYIETRFSQILKGSRQYTDISLARATLAFTAQPSPAEAVTIGVVVYTFVAALSGAGDVLIGSDLKTTIENLNDAVNLNASTSGTAYHASTVANALAGGQLFPDDNLLAFALDSGTAGNAVPTTTTVTGATWNFATLVGGSSSRYPQPLSFPRANLYDRDGTLVAAMPDKLLAAFAEYAVRARGATLAPDPTVDPLGGTVSRIMEKVGPIETDTSYVGSTANGSNLPVYPSVDRLLAEYINSSARTIRG